MAQRVIDGVLYLDTDLSESSQTLDVTFGDNTNVLDVEMVGGGTSVNARWGRITGNIDDQLDLQAELAKKVITLTKAQYDALSAEEKNDPEKVYYIYDYDASGTYSEIDDTTTAIDKLWSSSKVASELATTARIDDTVTTSDKAWSSTKIATELGNKYDFRDTERNNIDDADYIPFYDYSESSKHKTKWSNIIAKIKAKLATVATTGSYNDLTNKPTIPAAQVNSDWNASSGVAQILNKPNLATVATSGSYTDLTNQPTIPDELADLQDDATHRLVTDTEKTTWNGKSVVSANPATTTGTLTGIEIDGTAYAVQGGGGGGASWGSITGTLSNQTDLKGELDKKVLTKTKAQYDALPSAEKQDADSIFFISDYEDTSKTWVALDDTTTANDKVWSSSKISSELGRVAQIDDTTTSATKAWSSTKISTELSDKYDADDAPSSDLANDDFVPFYDYSGSARKKTTFTSIKAFLKSYFDTLYAAISHTHTKSQITDFPTLATVATSGSYNDLSNKPTIPSAQVNSDWNSSSGVSEILNKPTIPTITDTYSGTSSDGMSGKAVKSAIDALDGTVTGSASASKTLTAFSQTDGVVSATFGDISITKSQVSDFPTLATVATSGSYDDLVDEPTNQSASQYSQTTSLCTRHEKYLWNTAYNSSLKWWTGSALTGATSIWITVDLSDIQGDLVAMLADDGTNKPVKYKTVEVIQSSGGVPDGVQITFSTLAHDTDFKVGMI